MKTCRLFIGIPVALEQAALFQKEGANLSAELQSLGCRTKAIPAENYHITLAFLGDQSQDKLPTLQNIVQDVSKLFSPTTWRVNEWNVFRHTGSPSKTVWMGSERNETLVELHHTLKTKLESVGFHLEKRPFQAHVSILRIQSWNPAATRLFPKPLETTVTIAIKQVSVFESQLSPTGATYSVISAANF